ncbi:MAG: DNA-3-methyladenine glycosylase 2 family protein [Proteobacteria bacterium]|nr:DNA-3-methyladenine glycosylase 2 family protein [Pseudomonadota bacterium]
MNQHIVDHLGKADAVLAGVMRAVGPPAIELDAECHPFEALARAIAHQQLNGTAAGTILRRLVESCGTGAFPTPRQILDAPQPRLRAAGFSFAKIAALRDLAARTLDEIVPDHATLQALGDEEIVARLTEVRGIGRWTVEMLLMFRLGRPDVLPIDDFGVQAGFKAAYGLKKLPQPKALAKWGERWKPYRSTAAWYLWRALELAREGRLPPPAERIRLPVIRRRRKRSAPIRKSRKRPSRRPDRRERTARSSRSAMRAASSSARLRPAGARTPSRRRPARRSRAPASKK